MGLLSFLTIGVVIGLLTGRVLTYRGFGYFSYVMVALIGATVGGYAFDAFEIPGDSVAIDLGMAVLGALLFVMVCSLFEDGERPQPRLHQS